MPCDQWRAQIDAYLDRELSASDSRAMADHLQQCPDCTAEVLEHLQLKRAIATVGRDGEQASGPLHRARRSRGESSRRPSGKPACPFRRCLGEFAGRRPTPRRDSGADGHRNFALVS